MVRSKRHGRKAPSAAAHPSASLESIPQHSEPIRQLSEPILQQSEPIPQQSEPIPQQSEPRSDAVQNQPRRRRGGSESTQPHKKTPTRYWTVDLIGEDGVVTKASLRVKDLRYDLPGGKKIVVEWNRNCQPVGDSGGLLGGYLGELASNASKFPINFVNWHKVSSTHKNHVWNDSIKKKFIVNEEGHRKYILENLGKKWRDSRARMYADCFREQNTWEQNLEACPDGVPLEQWVSFLEYRASEKAKKYSEKNTANRLKQTVPHTLGTMTIARKKHELETQTRRSYSRVELYSITHKRSDGSFVNDEAREKNEQLEMAIDNNMSEEEAFTTIIGKEQYGRVRGMGFGVCPSQVLEGFGGSSSGSSSSQVTQLQSELEAERARVDALEKALEKEVTKFKSMEEQLAFLMQHVIGYGFNQVSDVGSPNEVRRSSSASHQPVNNGPST
ncbi:uncharacterized protein LOC130736752 [Lotus japonicus]|uniref:uncharacterized protein LOC130736752 n=1 Tax=Lotus japonicus TaxID=34305 RepID=UPI00258BED47|nr:uncharacterized protein LOC130736752 [Lotus japonicus]